MYTDTFIELTHPDDALAFIRREFPRAHLTYEYSNSSDHRICGYWFRLNNRSKHFAPMLKNGGVDLRAIRLWRDAQAYARDKAAAKRRKTSLFQLGWEDFQRGEACPTHYPARASGWYAAENDREIRQDEEQSKFNRTRR